MKNIKEILKDTGIELTDEQVNAIESGVNENYKTRADYDKQVKKLNDTTAERDKFKEQYETASETLKGFEGKDFDAITKERDEWKAKAEQTDKDWDKKLKDAEDSYNKQIEERDFNDVLSKALSSEKFSSEFAKTGIIDMVKKKGLKREGDKILGLDDYLTELKTSQKDAFVSAEDTPKPPTFTKPTSGGGDDGGAKKFTVPKVW